MKKEFIGKIIDENFLYKAEVEGYDERYGTVCFRLPFEGKFNQRVKITFELLEDEK